MFNIFGYQRNANQNIEILFHLSQNGHHQENKQQQMLASIQGKKHPYATLVGM
jgi:hypothetical protein